MKHLFNKFPSESLCAALIALTINSPAYAGVYDGTWKVTTWCGTNSINKKPPFSIDTEIKIVNDFIKYQWSFPNNEFIEITNWGGKISGKSISIAAKGNRSNGESWSYNFEGSAINPQKITATGSLWSSDNRKARDCTIDLVAIQLTSQNPSKAEIEATRSMDKAWFEAEKQKLEAQQAAIESKSQEIEKKERQLREKEALLKKEKAAKDVSASKPTQNSTPASVPLDKPKPSPVSSGF